MGDVPHTVNNADVLPMTQRRRWLSPQQIRAAKREAEAVEMRLAGKTYADIAEALDCSVGTAHNYVAKAMYRWGSDTVEQLRQIELRRLDVITEKLWEQVEYGDPAAIEQYLRVSDRRAKLVGLDAPKTSKVQVEAETRHKVALEVTADVSEFQKLMQQIVFDQAAAAIEAGQVDVAVAEIVRDDEGGGE